MSIILKSGNSVDLINSDGSGNIQVNVKAPVDSAGNILISNEGKKATYVAAFATVAILNGITFTFLGSATKKVKISRIIVTCDAASANTPQIAVTKTSTAPTGGVQVGSTAANVPMDSTDPASTVLFKAYSTAPTSGTVVGLVTVFNLLAQSATVGGSAWGQVEYGEDNGMKPLTLAAGALEGLTIAFNTTGPNARVTFWWTEE